MSRRVIALLTAFCFVMAGFAFAADYQIIHQDGKPYRHPAAVTEHVSVSASAVSGKTWFPYPGLFTVSLLLTGSPTCLLQRQVDHYTRRVGTISGGTNVVLTTGTTDFLQTGMHVSGVGILPNTIITYVDLTHFTLSQAAENNSGVEMEFWINQATFTTSQNGINAAWPIGVPWRTVYVGTGTATMTYVQ